MRGMATLPQGNQELLVVKDKVGRPQVSLDDLTGALHDLIAPVVQLSPPPPSSFASINTG